MLGGGVVLLVFLWWERRRLDAAARARSSTRRCCATSSCAAGVISFLFMFLVQAGLFFVVPLFLSVALGLSAIDTGVRLLPLSLTLLAFAAAASRSFARTPRRGGWCNLGFMSLFAGLVLLVLLLDVGRRARRS